MAAAASSSMAMQATGRPMAARSTSESITWPAACIRLAHAAIAIDIGQRRQGLQQLGHIARGGCTLGQSCIRASTSCGKSASSASSMACAISGSEVSGVRLERSLAVAAWATVAPCTLASMMRTASSGSHCSCQLSRKVPRLRWVGGAHAPVNAEQAQTVQKMAACQIRVLAQIQRQQLACRLGLETQRLLLLLDIALQRHLGHIGGTWPST
jgi:hypothetical protein